MEAVAKTGKTNFHIFVNYVKQSFRKDTGMLS